VEIVNRQGLHARPATQFVETANRFGCHVTVHKADAKVNGKSIMEMMLLEATRGTVLTLEAEGGDAEPCLDALEQLIREKFHED
jgi:phosphocarrier protein